MARGIYRFLIAAMMMSSVCVTARATELRWNESTSAEIDQKISQLMAQMQTPGVAVAIIHDGKLLKESYYGLASLEYGVPVTNETAFWLASVSKQFTAALILVLEQQGRLSLDDSILKHLPELPKEWKDIRIRHLLTQTSGLNGYEDDRPACVICQPDWGVPQKEADYLRAAAKIKPDFVPGEKFHYGDTNPELLAIIATRIAGKPFPQLMRELVFAPSGMNSSYIYDYARVETNQVTGYAVSHGVLRRDFNRDSVLQLDQKNTAGAGNIFATLGDMIRWNTQLSSTRLLNRENHQRMWAPVKLNSGETAPYGFSFEVNEYPGGSVIGHDGIAGTGIWKLPQEKLDIIVLTNHGMSFAWAYVTGIADTLGLLEGLTPARMADELGVSLAPDVEVTARGRFFWRWANTLDMELALSESIGEVQGSFAGVPVTPYALDDGRILLYSKMFWFPRRGSFPAILKPGLEDGALYWEGGDPVVIARQVTPE